MIEAEICEPRSRKVRRLKLSSVFAPATFGRPKTTSGGETFALAAPVHMLAVVMFDFPGSGQSGTSPGQSLASAR